MRRAHLTASDFCAAQSLAPLLAKPLRSNLNKTPGFSSLTSQYLSSVDEPIPKERPRDLAMSEIKHLENWHFDGVLRGKNVSVSLQKPGAKKHVKSGTWDMILEE